MGPHRPDLVDDLALDAQRRRLDTRAQEQSKISGRLRGEFGLDIENGLDRENLEDRLARKVFSW